MIYRIDCSRWGRFFSVPCSVVDEYIKISDGAFIKVLLCILCSSRNIIDTEAVADQAGVSQQTVSDSILYWSGLGVITASDEKGNEVVSAKTVNAPSDTDSTAAAEKKLSKSAVRYSPKDLSEKINKNEELKLLANDVQKILGRPINASETAGLLNLYEYYGFSAASVLMIVDYCHKLGKDRFAYIERVAKDWFERGIVSYADVEAEIINQSRIKSYQYKASNTFGMSSKPSKKQLEYFEEWRLMGFSIEMLEIAYDKCMNVKNELNFSYIDGILKNWAGKAIKTPEQVSEDDKRFTSGNKRKYNPKTENKDASYNLDEWERYAMNFDPNKRGEQ